MDAKNTPNRLHEITPSPRQGGVGCNDEAKNKNAVTKSELLQDHQSNSNMEHYQTEDRTMHAPARPPEAPPGRPVAADEEDGDVATDKMKLGSQDQLVRRWSTPARVKHFNSSTLAHRKILKDKENCKFRHSHRDNKNLHNTKGPDESHQIFRQKSITSLRPTSSSASDSAFSQSQTTLETDSETLNRFSTKDPSKSSADNDRLSSNDGSSSNSDGIAVDQDNHFEIVWQNLSYKVPEKRFSRLATFASKVKAKWASATREPSNRSDPSSDCKPPFQSAPSAASVTDDDHHQLDRLEDGLAPSTSGNHDRNPALNNRQRQTIFSNLNGCVKSGQLTAILGPSGAGKTTFLKCLTNSITKGVSGSISIHSVSNGGGGSELESNAVGPYKSSQHLKLCIIPQKGE